MTALKMLKFLLVVIWMERIRIDYVRETAQVERSGDKVRQARMFWISENH